MSIILKDAAGNSFPVAGGRGLPGKSAYQQLVESGFTGTEDEFMRLMIGSGENLLDNSYFLDPINQRGQEEYTGVGYMIDRWRGQRPEIKLELTPKGIRLSTDTVNVARGITQPLDDDIVKALLGKTVTVSALVTEHSGVDLFHVGLYSSPFASGVTTGTVVATGGNGLVTITWQVPEELPPSHTHLNFYIGFQNTTAVNSAIIQAAKLELGPVQTLAHQDASGNWVLNDPPPNRALELLKCQRYMQVYCRNFKLGRFAPMSELSGDGFARFAFSFPEMRAIPTVINDNSLGTRIISGKSDLSDSTYTFTVDKNILTITDTNPNIKLGNIYTCGTTKYAGLLILDANL